MQNINPNPATCSTQKDQILAYLKEGKTLTSLQALRMFGCLRLGARVHDLQKDGHSIHSKLIVVKSNGVNKHVSEYKLIKAASH